MWHNMDVGSKNSSNSSLYNMSKGMGFVGRVNYSYMGKYLFSASVRHDGSSRLNPREPLGYIPCFLTWMENVR